MKITTVMYLAAFQSTPPGWEATRTVGLNERLLAISIHASRVGGDIDGYDLMQSDALFQSTPPGWEATCIVGSVLREQLFQSTPPGWEATETTLSSVGKRVISIHASRVGGDNITPVDLRVAGISIHASRVGGDALAETRCYNRHYFNPRLPGGRRQNRLMSAPMVSAFQSTPPGWEATRRRSGRSGIRLHFNPRLPGGRRRKSIFRDYPAQISIHASRVGGDRRGKALPPMLLISIHASRVGGDSTARTAISARQRFQSTPPGWEATLTRRTSRDSAAYFKSTPPGWEATPAPRLAASPPRFQSTPPGWEATRSAVGLFQSR